MRLYFTAGEKFLLINLNLPFRIPAEIFHDIFIPEKMGISSLTCYNTRLIYISDACEEKNMKRSLIIYILLAGVLLWVLGACTPPPQNPKEDEPKSDADQVTPIEGESEIENQSPVSTESLSGAPGEGLIGEDMEPSEGDGETGVTSSNQTFPDNYFSGYTTWPPDSIKPEDVETLRHARVVFETTKGIIKITLFPDQAPLHSANLVKLVQDGFYDGLKFHRVMSNFMSQGGDPLGTGEGGPTPDYTLPAEIGLPHVQGSMAAARTGGVDPATGQEVNPEKRSSGSQFYFVHTDTSANFLDGNYTVYGQIVDGIDVNLSLTVNYTNDGPIPDAQTDSIVRATVEYG